MMQSISAELLVLRKRASTWILLGIWLTVGLIFAYIVPYVTWRNNGDTGSGPPLADLLPHNLTGTMLAGFPFFGGAIVLMLGVLSFGSEYGWGTFKTLFTQKPGRLRILGAKLAALGIALIPFVVLTFVVGAISSFTIAQIEGADVTWPSVQTVVEALGAAWFILAVWAALGSMLAIASRGTALAIGIGILYAFVLEGLLSALTGQISLLDPLVEFFLRANTYSLVSEMGISVEDVGNNGPGSFSGPFVDPLQAFLVLSIYLAGFLAVSAYLLRRRDVAG